MSRSLDLNADLGEGVGDDEALLDIVTSANIACGFHAGDPATMRATVEAAARRRVAIGAHPGYPDRMGFGRRALDATPEEIAADVVYQVGALAATCAAAGARLRYVKPHGALYNRAAVDRAAARAVAGAVRAVDPGLRLLGLAGSVLVAEGREAGVTVAEEAFADRAYRDDGTLLPRTEPGALLLDREAAVSRAVRLAKEGRVRTAEGADLALRPDSLCVHGDSPGAVELARAIRAALEQAGLRLAPFAP